MIALITGGRDYRDAKRVDRELSRVLLSAKARHRGAAWPLVILQGASVGAEQLAWSWARDAGVPCLELPALHDFYEKQARTIRNTWLTTLLKVDVLIAFPGKDTGDLIAQARAAGIRIVEVKDREAA